MSTEQDQSERRSTYKYINFFHLLSDQTPTRTDISVSRAADTYKLLLMADFEFYRDENEIILRGAPLLGKPINDLMYIAAPSKTFGLDTHDIINDWTDLFTKPYHENRLKAHRQVPGWALFEKGWERILKLIKEEKNAKPIVPIVRIKIENNLPSWNLQNPPKKDISSELLLGLLVVAALSPEITNSWESHQSYNGKSQYPTQNMGATQVLPLIVTESEALLDTKVVKSILELDKKLT